MLARCALRYLRDCDHTGLMTMATIDAVQRQWMHAEIVGRVVMGQRTIDHGRVRTMWVFAPLEP